MGERIRVLITVKTYPLPSRTYGELVCTAGVREEGGFVRLHPIDYRYRPYWQWYDKYQWVEVEVEKHSRDPRPESFRPLGDIEPLGHALGTEGNWTERKRYVLMRGVSTMCELQQKPQTEISLGIIRPAIVSDFVARPTDREWKTKWRAEMQQLSLFGPQKKPLEKIPYNFSYAFTCEAPGCKGHKMMIEDWEVGELYRKMRDKWHDEQIACEKVREKFFGQICAPNVDTHFFVGTVRRHGTWIVIGTFYPKKAMTASLFNSFS